MKTGQSVPDSMATKMLAWLESNPAGGRISDIAAAMQQKEHYVATVMTIKQKAGLVVSVRDPLPKAYQARRYFAARHAPGQDRFTISPKLAQAKSKAKKFDLGAPGTETAATKYTVAPTPLLRFHVELPPGGGVITQDWRARHGFLAVQA